MTIFAGLVEAVLSRLLLKLRVVFQPTISGFTVLVVGLQLGLVGITQTLDVPEEGTAVYLPHFAVALITLAVSIGFSIWGRGVLRLICTLLGVGAGVAAAVATGLIDATTVAPIGAAPWLALPDPSFLSYAFDAPLMPAFIAAGFAATLRTIGTITSCQKINDAGWKHPDLANIKRGVLGDSIGTLVAGVLGCPGMSSAPSLVGVSSATGATSRVIAYVAAAFLFLFAFLPKIGATIIGLPLEIAGAILVFTSSFMITSGLEIISARSLDTRACFALSIGILLGLATQVVPAYFHAIPEPWNRIAGDMLTISLAATIGLTLVFRIGIRRKDAMVWQATDDALSTFGTFLDKEAGAWKLGADVVARAKEVVAEIVHHLKDGRLLDEPTAIDASYDKLDLGVELKYRGRPLTLVEPQRGHERTHEEAAATAGLKSFAAGMHADRASVATNGDDVAIRLWFNA